MPQLTSGSGSPVSTATKRTLSFTVGHTWLSPEFRDWNIEEYLPGVCCPVLVIQGIGDQYGTTAQVKAIERQVSGRAKPLLVPCGHIPHAEAREKVLEEMAGFIRECLEEGEKVRG
jgi:pimeloyl-ACP methyl ester carboxylesterase